MQVNGAAARLVSEGDKVIVASFGAYDDATSRPTRRWSSTSTTTTGSSAWTAPRGAPRLMSRRARARHGARAEQDPEAGARRAVTLPRLAEMKAAGEPIVMVTAYDHPSAQAVEEAGVDVVLVGDSAAMTVLGYDSTTSRSGWTRW